MKTMRDLVIEHAVKDTYDTSDGMEMLELTDCMEHNSAANIYLAALGIIRDHSAELARVQEQLTRLQHYDVMMRRALLQIQKLCNDTGDLDMEEFAGDVQELAVEALALAETKP